MALWASEAGIPRDQWYSHGIPGDYMFGTTPDAENMNARYFSSASPLWASDVSPYGSPGLTIYDVKFPPGLLPDEFYRTTEYGLEALAKLSNNFAVLEYDAETYPPGLGVTQSSWQDIYAQFMRLYNSSAHLINFFRWWDESSEHRIKGLNKETALKEFINQIRDKARNTNLEFVFDPPKVSGFTGKYFSAAQKRRLNARIAAIIQIQINRNIWDGHSWEWADWGDFAHFEIYRGDTLNFPADANHLIGTTGSYTYQDTTAADGKSYYYKIRAINSKGVGGPLLDEIRLPGFVLSLSAGTGGTTDPSPGIYFYDSGFEMDVTALPQNNYYFTDWTGDASGSANPLHVILNDDKSIMANFMEITVFPPINFSGQRYENLSLVQIESVIRLKWEVNPLNKDITKYKIYHIEEGAQTVVAELNPDIFEYTRRRTSLDKSYVYAITALNNQNMESPAAWVIVE